MSRHVTRRSPRWRDVLVGSVLVLILAPPALAQAPSNGPNSGALTFTGGFDLPTVYFFRGMRQEGDPRLTVQPYGDLGIAFADRVRVNIGVWNSLHTGTAGTGRPSGKLQYEERFYSSLTLGLAERLSFVSTYEAYTSPNGSFSTVKEANFKLAQNGAFAPYAFLAFELSDEGQADGGYKKGTYLELGAAPHMPIGPLRATVSVPVRAGFSLSNYYELIGSTGTATDHKFGFFDIGGLATIPIGGIPPRFGSWNVHGGADFLTLGDTTRAFNKGDKNQIIGLIGIGVSY